MLSSKRNVNETETNTVNRIPHDVIFYNEDLRVLSSYCRCFYNVPMNFYDDIDDNDATTQGDGMMNHYNRNYNGSSVCELGIGRLVVGSSAIGEGNQFWEPPVIANFRFKGIKEYALSTPYALSCLTQGFLFRSKDYMNLIVESTVLKN